MLQINLQTFKSVVSKFDISKQLTFKGQIGLKIDT